MSGAGSGRAGVAWMVLTTFLWCCTDALAKHLSATYPALQITWVRCIVQMVILAAIFAPRFRAVVATRSLTHQIVRSALMMVGATFTFVSVAKLPLVFVSSVNALAPVIVTVLAAWLLSESVGLRRWLALAVGFTGALVIIGPTDPTVTGLAVLPVIAVAGNAAYQVWTRRLRGVDPVETTLLYTCVVGTAAGFIALPLAATGIMPWDAVWVTPDAWGWIGLLVMGVSGVISHTCLTMAYTLAPASVVAPFVYTGLIWAAGLGVSLFGEIPTVSTLAGAAVIVMAGLSILLTDTRRPMTVRSGAQPAD